MPSQIKDATEFDKIVKDQHLSVVHFKADWVEQCGQVDEVLDTLAKHEDYSKVKFSTCPAEDLSEVSLKYNIEAVPTIILFRSGKEVDRVNGIDPAKLTEKIKQHNHSDSTNSISLEDRLKSLINRSKVMLFMKGDRNVPRCGFSRQIIDILNSTGVAYDTFDILTDEEVRQGLKTYSDWPTYPQLYVNGDLLGGLDIIKEMLAGGELVSTLKS